ncbi:MAG: cation:proton antiporter [Egibacteraceae bacterium]
MPPFELPQLPLTSATLVFATLMALVLAAPVLAERIRVPGIIGLVAAGVLIGPGGVGVLSRTGIVSILAELGLLYLTFQVGLRLNLDALRSSRRAWMMLGGLMFAIPMALGIGGALALGYASPAAVLIGAWWAAHTLVAYPVYERFGVVEDRSVQAAVGGTIVANTAALLVLGADVWVFRAPFGWVSWAMLALELAALLGLTLWALPRCARWFFAGMGQDRCVRFLFVLSALFASTAFAEAIGLEGIVGAFLTGLALNRLVPSGGVLMERVEFFGSAFLVPIFLIWVGMLIDFDVLTGHWRPALSAVVFTAVVIVSKGAAALGAGRLLRFDGAEIGAMFSLSVTQAELTLAGVVVGLGAGIIGPDTVHAVVPVIVVTCLLGSWTANRWAPRLPSPPVRPPGIGEAVLVPVSSPDSARGLVRLAALLARPECGKVMPLTVVGPESTDEDLEHSRELAARAESMALSQGVEATGIVRIDGSPSAGVLHTIVEYQATFMLVGWKGYTGTRESLFGSVIDSIVGRSSVPLAVARLVGDRFDRILLSIFTGNLPLGRRPGVQLAAEIARRVAAGTAVPAEILTDSDDPAVSELLGGQLKTRVHHDTRRQHVAIGHHARAEDLVIVSVSPTETGLRTAATRIAWAAPESSVIVALDAGLRRVGVDPDQRQPAWDMWVRR